MFPSGGVVFFTFWLMALAPGMVSSYSAVDQ